MAAAAGGAVTRRVPALALAGVALAAAAQNPFIDAARANAAALPPPAAPPAAVVQAFVAGCIAHDGESMKTVDWAINEGFEWVDAQVGLGATVLSGRPGTALAMPGSAGSVLLAIDLDRRCTVWAERADGPALRAEFSRAMSALAARGARVQPTLERSVERGGAWRLQLQMRLRRADGTAEVDVGAVTTLTPQPAPQVLSVAPVPR